MKLEKQTTSLKLSKRLKELGVEQESYFNHIVVMPDPIGEDYYYEIADKNSDYEVLTEIVCSAFTVAELGAFFKQTEKFYQIETFWDFDNNKYRCILLKLLKEECGKWDEKEWFDDENEVNARAKMLIYLIENKLWIQKK